MDGRYKQLSVEDQLVEECAELIFAIQKLKRFGPIVVDPFTKIYYDNVALVKNEIGDVKTMCHNMLVKLDAEYK